MTYGWAILIIALSLVVLYSLGIMNPKNFIPRAPPGSCFVFRPNGPGTTDFVSLQGTCGYLPMYVASFNGVNAYIQVPDSAILRPANISIVFWMRPSKISSCGLVIKRTGTTANDANWQAELLSSGNLRFSYYNGTNWQDFDTTTAPISTLNIWYFVVMTFASGVPKIYVNGNLINQGSGYPPLRTDYTGQVQISRGYFGYFNGSIANVQIYSTALTPQQIQQLYLQGINSPPIPNAGLVGWWPLQGNANDYSPYNNFGTPYNVVYNSTYPAPITGQTIVGNKIIFGSGKGVYAYYFNGSSAWNFSTGANTVTGPISSYKNKVFFQTTGGIYALYSNNGSLAWYASPSLTASSGDYPVIGGDKVYAIWGDNKIYIYNVTNGNIISSISVPIVGSGHTSLALANGNLYVGMGNNIYAFGSCKADPSDTVLNAIARFYANKQYFCANMLAYFAFSNSSRQMNYGLWVNDTFLPSISASFNGVNAYINCGNGTSLSIPNTITIAFWFYNRAFNLPNANWGGDLGIVNKDLAYMLGTQSYNVNGIAKAKPKGWIWVGGSWYGVTGPNYLNTNRWYYEALVYNGSQLQLYLNGSKVNSTSLSGNINTPPYVVLIGCRNVLGSCYGSGSWFNGTLANVQIYNTALTPQQIQQLYLQGINSPPIPNAGLVGWWPLNGDTNDYSGWFNIGFPFNGVTFNATSYPISFTTSSSSTAFGAGFNAYGSTNATRAFDIAIAGWSK